MAKMKVDDQRACARRHTFIDLPHAVWRQAISSPHDDLPYNNGPAHHIIVSACRAAAGCVRDSRPPFTYASGYSRFLAEYHQDIRNRAPWTTDCRTLQNIAEAVAALST